jgi:hypothetical protein
MQMQDPDLDANASLLERRWIASIAAVRNLQSECDVLREVMEMADSAWQRARAQLSRLETVRDALAEELADRDVIRHQAERIPDDLCPALRPREISMLR